MKTSFITTVFNEQENIAAFVKSLFSQTKKPHEIIIVDGGSTDNTLSVISNFQFPISNNGIKFKILKKKGNRAVGRNEAIRWAKGDTILCSDVGCILDRQWVEKITQPFQDKTVDVVAGYYKGKPLTLFQKCLIPYVLVMPDKVNPQKFLPATRSIAFTKSIWKKVGGFPEEFSHNEDYVFAHKLKNNGAKIVFQENAIVYWQPRKNLADAFYMFFRFALGDAESGIARKKVIFLFTRYIAGILLLHYFPKTQEGLLIIFGLIIAYCAWIVFKNYAYVNDVNAVLYLPVIQFTSDVAVMLGTIIGTMKQSKYFLRKLY